MEPPVPDRLLAAGIDAAVRVARDGQLQHPPEPPPPRLRSLVRMRTLHGPARSQVRQVVDEDEDFRARVAAAVDEAAVGRASWLWLTRPEGWDEELVALAAAQASAEAERREERAEHDARRRLAGAEEARDRAERARDDARAALDALAAELAEERRARRRAELDLDASRVELDAATKAAEEARAIADEAVSALAEARERAEQAEGRARAAEAALADVEQRWEARVAEAGERERSRQRDQQRERVRATEHLTRAAAGAALLGEALAELGRVWAGGEGAREPSPAPSSSPGPAGGGARSPAGPGAPPRPRRRPRALPGGVFDDSAEAAEHLVRLPGAVLLVDGYNVSKTAWEDRPAAEQRDRLVSRLGALAARSGVEVTVVFDGAELLGPTVPVAAPRGVRVLFSPPDVEADDVVIDLVGEVALERPVVVASSDGRVRDGARARGANVVRAAQLVDVLRHC